MDGIPGTTAQVPPVASPCRVCGMDAPLPSVSPTVYHEPMPPAVHPARIPASSSLGAVASACGILILASAVSSCCESHSKVRQAARGQSFSRVTWSHRLGNVAHQGNVRLATTSTNEILVAATLQHDAKIGGQTLLARREQQGDGKASSADDVVVWKLNARGKPVWGRRFGDGSAQRANTVAVSGEGTVFVGGAFEGTMDWGKQEWKVADGVHAGFVGALDPSGAPGWGTWFDATPLDPKSWKGDSLPKIGAEVRALTSDEKGRLFVMGSYVGRFRIAGKEPIADDPDRGGGSFFGRFDAGGAMRWYRLASYPDKDTDETGKPAKLRAHLHDMTTSVAGDVVLVGTATGEGYFVGTPMKADPAGSLLVSAWSGTGLHMWSSLFPLAGELAHPRVVIARDGSVYVAGLLKGRLTVGSHSLEATGPDGPSTQLFAARLDSLGKALWAKNLAHARWNVPIGVAADSDRGFVVTATTGTGALSDVGGGQLFEQPLEGMDGVLFAAAYGPDGEHRWSRGFSTLAHNRSSDVVVTRAGKTVMAGLLNIGECADACEGEQLGDVYVAAMGK